ncbi:unnamed protein product [Medioppia subpectinata]|uniref:Uncharacterized protein n=1 Tax=Medioppia subpectinata TaxID=1979941 RepID=A0A7R9L7J2_9ACAR|nr:unnamed protein product [Medioppia subpectinata]CAG2115851.1 unnamed protein product [Medioppia subpectinata]
MFDVNVFGLINLTRIVLRYFLDNHMKGHFAVTSSTAGKLGVPNSGSYTASKHALHGYYECLRVEAQSRGISITMLCPGPVFSRVLENAMSNKLDSSHEVVTHSKDNKRLATSRCAHLMATAIANTLDERSTLGLSITSREPIARPNDSTDVLQRVDQLFGGVLCGTGGDTNADPMSEISFTAKH